MKINEDCIRCKICIPYCPLKAITYNESKDLVSVDQLECVECGVCYRSGVCPVDAIYQPELGWPRVLRAVFSSVVHIHKGTGSTGRGTEEMKTNDVTGRFGFGEVGFGLELGRPNVGAKFSEAEKLTVPLARLGVEFERRNPLTKFLDTETGRFKESWDERPLGEAFKDTKVMTFIIEFKTASSKLLEVYSTIAEASKELETVVSVDLITKCSEAGENPLLPILDEAGIEYYINGKTCVGLGKPAFVFKP